VRIAKASALFATSECALQQGSAICNKRVRFATSERSLQQASALRSPVRASQRLHIFLCDCTFFFVEKESKYHF
jgi:hypothetical protein